MGTRLGSHPHSASDASGPLSSYLVIDLSRAVAGPQAGMMLADLGARVIKVEQPSVGDESRSWGPPFVGPADAPESTYFMSVNRNKESIELDLKTEDGREVLSRLITEADVLVENFRPGVLDRLGFDAVRLNELNPGLVQLSISGFGHDGPQGGRPGYDQIAQGEAGLMSMTGRPGEPMRVGVPIADVLAGMNGAFGVAAALAERERSGRGAVVRTSLLAAIVGVHCFQGTRYTVAGEVAEGIGNHHAAIAPYGSFKCADGVVQIAVANERQWRQFAGLLRIGLTDARFATAAARLVHRDELTAIIENRFANTSVEECIDSVGELGIPCGRVRTIDQVYAWDQVRSQGLLIEVDHPTVGPIELPGPTVRLEWLGGTPRTPRTHQSPPTLGQHNESIRAWLAAADERGAAS